MEQTLIIIDHIGLPGILQFTGYRSLEQFFGLNSSSEDSDILEIGLFDLTLYLRPGTYTIEFIPCRDTLTQ